MAERKVVCVTGGTGMVGAPLVRALVAQGHQVRVLSRRATTGEHGVQVFSGSLLDAEALTVFLQGAHKVFHCAAELNDAAAMQAVNVQGTQNLIDGCRALPLEVFCFVSSAGVVGRTASSWVDEDAHCTPGNMYECTKLEAERRVLACGLPAKLVVLRPTNVVSDSAPGAALSGLRASWADRLKVFIKGRECAHLVHAEDVARAALFFSENSGAAAGCYFVSCDEDQQNTFGSVWALGRAFVNNASTHPVPWSIPVICMFVIRRLVRGVSNRGDVRYSSKRIRDAGFRFEYPVSQIVASAAKANSIKAKVR